MKFSLAGVKILPRVGSDHAFILMDSYLHDVRACKTFCFFVAWAMTRGVEKR